MRNDITVIGAGPAGLAAAICCSEMGFRVHVLDCAAFPRSIVGESVHPGAEALFRRLRVHKDVANARFLRFEGIWVRRPEGPRFVPFGGSAARPWKGFHVWRSEFDQILLDRARNAGARMLEHCTPSSVEAIAHGVRISSSAGAIESRIVVDATGRNRWLARRWGLKTEIHSRPLILRYGYRRGDCPRRRDNPLFAPRRDGWDWTARVKKDVYQWISLRFEKQESSTAIVPSEIRSLDPIGPSRGADVTWRLVTQAAGPRHFLVGDAAAILDPSSSHGIIKAISSGILAANCIGKIFDGGPRDRARVAQGYCAWLRKWFQRDARNLRDLNEW